MASSPITSWEIDGETVETVADFIFWGSKNTADGDCSHEIKRRLPLGRKVMTNLDSILKSMLRFMGSQRVRHDWVTELNWADTDDSNESFIILLSTLETLLFNPHNSHIRLPQRKKITGEIKWALSHMILLNIRTSIWTKITFIQKSTLQVKRWISFMVIQHWEYSIIDLCT